MFEKFCISPGYLPFSQLFDSEGKQLYGSLFAKQMSKIKKQFYQADDIEVTVDCTIRELYNGCLKSFSYDATVLTLDTQNLKKITIEK